MSNKIYTIDFADNDDIIIVCTYVNRVLPKPQQKVELSKINENILKNFAHYDVLRHSCY